MPKLQRHRCERGPRLADGGPDLGTTSLHGELRAEHLGEPLPRRAEPSTAEGLAAAYAAALALETGEILGYDDPARLT